jgi:DNA-binding response OmpR family regulator
MKPTRTFLMRGETMSKIMIVDDHKDIVDTIKVAMEKIGCETVTAFNGDEFLSKVDESKPDLVMLDVMMPGLTTKEILEKLKEKGQAHLKVILVTVVRFANEEREKLMKEYNIVDYITKPFNISDLITRVKKQL